MDDAETRSDRRPRECPQGGEAFEQWPKPPPSHRNPKETNASAHDAQTQNSSASDRAKPISRFNAPYDPADVTANRTANAKRASSQLPDHRATWSSRPGWSEPQLGGSQPGPKPELPSGPEPQIGSTFERPTRSCDVAIARLHNVDRESSQTGSGTNPFAGATSPATTQRPIMPRGTLTVSPPSEPPTLAHPKRKRPTRHFRG